jgi:hypothetical protein
MKIACFWIFLSILWLGLSWQRVAHLRAAGRFVSGFRYGAMMFWVVIAVFWIWNVRVSWKRLRANEG